jgi:translation initiation factor IF-3
MQKLVRIQYIVFRDDAKRNEYSTAARRSNEWLEKEKSVYGPRGAVVVTRGSEMASHRVRAYGIGV